MKKSRIKKILRATFGLFFLMGCLWVIFVPHVHTPVPNTSVTVRVQQPPLEIELSAPEAPLTGEEAYLPPPSQSGNVTVPVVPEEPSVTSSRVARIAIVIDDMGLEIKISERAILLPPEITLSFLPYAVRAREQAKEAQYRGHEILLHMPMEPLGNESPGRGALLVDLSPAEIRARFQTAMANLTGYDGINNHMGSKFTAYEKGMTAIVEEMKERGLFFLDSRTSVNTVGLKIARQNDLPALERDVFLDDDASPEAIQKQLSAVERVARSKGYAIAIGHPHLATIEQLEIWIAEAHKRGIELVPLNKLVKRTKP